MRATVMFLPFNGGFQCRQTVVVNICEFANLTWCLKAWTNPAINNLFF